MKICIVTPDIIGPIKNGGIGTHSSTLCRLLSNHQLTVLFTSTEEASSSKNWQKDYESRGIGIVHLNELKNLDPFKKYAPWEDWFLERSRRIYEYLEESDFDLVHFQDWHANGFYSIRARRTGVGLENTKLVLTMHSPSEWSRQGMQEWPQQVLSDMKLNLAERYCCEHVELLLAPSQHMFDWAIEQGWCLPEHRQVLHCAYLPQQELPKPSIVDPSHVLFFGRLETRKGLGIFLDGLGNYLTQIQNHGIKKVTFLGKSGVHQGQPSEKIISSFALRYPDVTFQQVCDKDSESALAYIADCGAIVYIPSLLDNCPYTVTECIERGFPFFAAATGGIPELTSHDSLFQPTREGVFECLDKRNADFPAFKHKYNAQENNQRWTLFHDELSSIDKKLEYKDESPLVSICVAYYNHPVYLPQLLASLAELDYENFEVIVANDGSTDPEANSVFKKMSEKYGERQWLFLEKSNGGVGHARNFAAQHAKGNYLVFCDADNVAMPGMLKHLVKSIQISGADCLTCYFLAFASDEAPDANTKIEYIFRPLGGRSPFGLLQNSYGDANFIIKRSVFDSVGGFTTIRHSSNEDWEILLNLYLGGFDVDVIPKELFWYRHLESGFSRVTNSYTNHKRVLSKVLEQCPPLQRELINNYAIPIFYQFLDLEHRLGKEAIKNRKTPFHKHIYRFYRWAIGDPKYKNK